MSDAKGFTTRAVSHAEATAIACRLIHGSFRRDGERAEDGPHFSIPTRPDHDDDCLILGYIGQVAAEIDRLKMDRCEEGVKHLSQEGELVLANCKLHNEIERLRAENADLKSSVVAFGGPWAAEYARSLGWPDGHLHPTHYDILKNAGARMDDFVRHPQDGSDA